MSCYFDSYFLSGKQAAVLGTGPGQRPGGQGRNLPITDQSLLQEMGTFQGGGLPHSQPPHTHTHTYCPYSGRGDVLTPGCAGAQAWSPTVLGSNPPKSLPGIGISQPRACLEPGSLVLHCGWAHTPSPRHRPDFLRCHPCSYSVRAGEMPWARGLSLKRVESHRRVSSPVLTLRSVRFLLPHL